MKSIRVAAVLAALALPVLLVPRTAAAEEIKGAAILDHACGKVAVKHMGLVHAGKMDEAVKLGTPEMQEQWKSMPAADREMMSGMMKDMSQSEADFSAEIKANGVLVVDGDKATLTVEKKTKDANGTSTETTTQRYVVDAKGCWITH
jgi:hypothetical protein